MNILKMSRTASDLATIKNLNIQDLKAKPILPGKLISKIGAV